jgi:MFS family permease
VGAAHFTSHFFQLSIAPLFTILHGAFKVDYVALGSLMTVFYLISGICQAFAGIVVDRFGARRCIIAGITLMACSIGLTALVTKFWMFYPLMALAGIGNSVFHPADFAAISHEVSQKRLGRAYSIHAFSGTIGYAAAPAVIGTIAVLVNWRLALGVAGILGIVVAVLFVCFGRFFTHEAAGHHKEMEPISYRKLIATPAILMAFSYFLFTSGAGTAVQAFSTVSLMHFYDVALPVAAAALSAYLIGNAVGMLSGGVIADATDKHFWVALGGLIGAALLMSIIALGKLPFALVIPFIAAAGLCFGLVAPSRDILVKGVTPKGATGRVFGFAYSGLDAGSTLAPIIFGAIVDRHNFHALFFGIAALYLAGIVSVFEISKRQRN